ncbi:type II toxin-antitoxin system Phd/YefM family antitoxin [Brevundimonas sp.]|uniref:type II toxin-antitoxin system Phd/YefM family antitoxin n=1 Tax=Brevundimonas sp. TaxID=1871086 RepID=UPI002ABC2EB5|nr:type II toxin-antitoxin system Phd/YefM family antitoxin [Brevundimonas sp.]MDZ4362181.1 type II toxin-antitoxin system Phd/YefM family antitoxin [Brevundimonas sp.]
MREVGVLEAKTSFTSLIAEVERTGEEVVVTRHGKAAVRIVPMDAANPQSSAERIAVAEDVIAWRDAQPFDNELAQLSWEDVKRLIRDEDRHD